MKKGGKGGGATITGLQFEERRNMLSLIEGVSGYSIKNSVIAGKDVLFDGQVVARSIAKHALYRFLEDSGIVWKELISKKLLPDEAILVGQTLYILELKYQNTPGSVDEKLQTCDFKRKQYLKLVTALSLDVEYIYVLSKWFKDDKYKDVLEYIKEVNCHYVFEELPLSFLKLPTRQS